MNNYYAGKTILVTGCCGTVGSELIRQLVCDYGVEDYVCVDNNESELFMLEQRFRDKGNGKFFLADIRDHDKLNRLMDGIDIVFHTAAYKHVILCERSPFEAVQTNILGIQNIIMAARKCHVSKVIFTSSDKAVNPTNVMGTSKLMGERLFSAADSNRGSGETVFASTRFGNVLGSRGSVIPIFVEQIKQGGPITVTDNEMSRFIMSRSGAVQLVVNSAPLAVGGEVFITKMPVINIRDLAEVMIEYLAPQFGKKPKDIEISIIGAKPGEKMYEELMSDEETRRAVELKDYFSVIPAYKGRSNDEYVYPGVISEQVEKAYNSSSEAPLSKEELLLFLLDNHILSEAVVPAHPSDRY